MKIIIIGPAHPYRGGIADTNESFCRSLLDANIDASIITFKLQYPEFLFPGKTQFTEEEKPKDLTISRLINTINPLNWISTARKINKMKPDLVVVRYWLPFLGPCLGSIAKLLNNNIKLIAMCDNIIPHEKRFGDVSFTKYFLSAFDGFITLSKAISEELVDYTNRPKVYFPHPINTNLGDKLEKNKARDYLNLERDGKYLLFFGLIRKYKGLDLTLEALAKVKMKDDNIILLVVGEFYESPDTYDAIIKKHNLENQVIIINEFVATEKIKYYFSAADLIIQTYHTASQSGITQIALNFDAPILVTNVGGLAEVVQHKKTGYVCEKNPEIIADSIADFFENERAVDFIPQIQVEKKKYSWLQFSKELVGLYKEL